MKNKLIALLLIINSIGFNILIASEEESMVTIHAIDTNLPDLLATLAEESGFNIVTGPNVNSSELLTIHLDNVPIDQAINLIVRAAGLSYEIVGNSILVAHTDRLTEDVGVMPYIVSLKYANAEEISKLLLNITNQITIDRTGNNLLVNASPKKIAEIEEIIDKQLQLIKLSLFAGHLKNATLIMLSLLSVKVAKPSKESASSPDTEDSELVKVKDLIDSVEKKLGINKYNNIDKIIAKKFLNIFL